MDTVRHLDEVPTRHTYVCTVQPAPNTFVRICIRGAPHLLQQPLASLATATRGNAMPAPHRTLLATRMHAKTCITAVATARQVEDGQLCMTAPSAPSLH